MARSRWPGPGGPVAVARSRPGPVPVARSRFPVPLARHPFLPRPGGPVPVPVPRRSRLGLVLVARSGSPMQCGQLQCLQAWMRNLFQEYGCSTLFSKPLVRGKQYCEVGIIIEQKQEPNGCQSQLLDMKTLDVATVWLQSS